MGAPADGKRDITTRWTEQDERDIERFRAAKMKETREDWPTNRAIRELLRLGFRFWRSSK